MFVKLPELRMNKFTAYAHDVSDGISAANHYVDGHHAFTMWQVEPDVAGLTNFKVIVSTITRTFCFSWITTGLTSTRQFVVSLSFAYKLPAHTNNHLSL